MTLSAADLSEVFASPSKFAEMIVGEPLWGYQEQLAESTARYRVVCAGRQVGKSRTLAICALHRAFMQPKSLVLLVSAGETASLRLLDDCSALALNSDLLAGAVIDDSKTTLTLSNGSRIISVPASERQIRGWPVDLLIVDEAGFVSGPIWSAAEPAIIARPGSRVILTSSPWGSSEHFFQRLWKQGMSTPTPRLASFHWPSSYSPLISDEDLADLQSRTPAHDFDREYLAQWTDEAGAYFTTQELDNAVAAYDLLPPEKARRQLVAGGIDWGFSRDGNAVVFLAALSDIELNEEHVGREKPVFYIPWLEVHYQMQYSTFIDRLDKIADTYAVTRYISEGNGVGAMPTQELLARMWQHHSADRELASVVKVTTDARRKANGFGRIKVLLQQGRLVLPNHPDLLRQLHALEFEQTQLGTLKIAVPETSGHDDLAMALLQAVSAINPFASVYDQMLSGNGAVLTTPGGTRIHTEPRAHRDPAVFASNANRI